MRSRRRGGRDCIDPGQREQHKCVDFHTNTTDHGRLLTGIGQSTDRWTEVQGWLVKDQRGGGRVVKRATRPGSRRRRTAADQPVVTIRTQVRQRLIEARVLRHARVERLAEEWTYILRSRTRWADDQGLRQAARERALDDLERVGVPRTFMKRLASCSHVEVELHGWDPADADTNRLHEAAAEVPWEYLISAGTRGVGRYHNHEINRLRIGPVAVDPAYYAIMSNFETQNPEWRFWRNFRKDRAMDLASDIVFPGDNDLVVDTWSMTDFGVPRLKLAGRRATSARPTLFGTATISGTRSRSTTSRPGLAWPWISGQSVRSGQRQSGGMLSKDRPKRFTQRGEGPWGRTRHFARCDEIGVHLVGQHAAVVAASHQALLDRGRVVLAHRGADAVPAGRLGEEQRVSELMLQIRAIHDPDDVERRALVFEQP
jgi:hypothetical protein